MSEDKVVEALERSNGSAYVWELRDSTQLDDVELGRALWSLRSSGEVNIVDEGLGSGLLGYLASPMSWWAWLGLLGVALGVIAAELVPHSPPQLEFIKVVMGAPSLFYLPGLSLVRALYPEGKWKGVDEAAAAISLSLAVLPIIGITLITIGVRLTITSTLVSVDGFDAVMIMVAAKRRSSIELSRVRPSPRAAQA